ncbi:MAG: bifunctional riboflavin kinase/FAD synthetase [Hymenobacteraceae bacterium]|nr:bifunctional riboflavin kinase/FAD synthetase [Hymenobacteraceae bacterium]MDX5395994.1 bifunctional riboflavin kinase/FAD synthetase [Hymenobacteraceae bacterium]MDX5512056.1 bifunctional riboflavin kinase/FAD synthetase [Hymenobacteraceae bacterium]
MEVIRNIEDFPKLENAVVTSGTFDGVHIGHQKILHRLTELARQTDGKSVVITYWPHPRLVLFPDDNQLKLLSTIEERIACLREFGVDYLLIIPFTKEFSRLSSQRFIREILVNTIGTKRLVIGYDHRFGKNREGSFEHLKAHASQYGFEVEEIPREDVDDVGVSSTKIRKALEAGDIETATLYLGRPYTLTGTVTEGDKLGRTIGYPTANISVREPHKLIPAQGVYAVKVQVLGQQCKGMLNIGTRPTVGGTRPTIEVNIFDFTDDIYGKELTLNFIAHLRPEQKFNGLEELQAQLSSDKAQAIKLLA